MSRSGYSNDGDNNFWRGAVARAMRGHRGQAFLEELLIAFEALHEKKIITNELEKDGNVCAIGAVGVKRGVDMSKLDPEDSEVVARAFGIANAMAAEIMYMNDEYYDSYTCTSPEDRYIKMYGWIKSQITPDV